MRFLITSCLTLGIAAGAAPAQTPATSGPIDLSALPAQIKTLAWNDIDPAAAAPLERIRALMLLNDALDELSARLTAESDLLSTYLDNTNLGPTFAAAPPPDDSKALTYANAQQISIALLRGPMAQSSYATQLGDAPSNMFAAYEHMYTSTAQRKWGALVDARSRVRAMSQFLQAQSKMNDYRAWVPSEIKLQAEQQKAVQAQQAAAAATRRAQQQQKEALNEEQRLARERQQDAQAAQAAQQQFQAAQQMQQSMCVAQQSLTPAQQSQANADAMAANTAVYPNWYYGGVTALGATAATSAWYHSGAYQGEAQARTDARFAGWHGGGFRR